MTKLSVPDMSCGHCKASVLSALTPLASAVSVDLDKREVSVEGAADTRGLIAALAAIGFPATAVAG